MNGIIIGFQDVYMCMTLRNQIKIRERWPKTTHCTALIVVVYKYTHKHEGIHTHTETCTHPLYAHRVHIIEMRGKYKFNREYEFSKMTNWDSCPDTVNQDIVPLA